MNGITTAAITVCTHILWCHVYGWGCAHVWVLYVMLAKTHATFILLTSNVHDHNGWYKFSHHRQYKAKDCQQSCKLSGWEERAYIGVQSILL